MLQKGDKPQAPSGALDRSKTYIATFKTEIGTFKAELYDDKAPLAVENFVNLARIGYFDNTVFHRVLENFMAQGGDPTGTGSSGPGYRFKDEIDPGLIFDSPGILGMANSGPNTNGSQFFVTFVATPHLNGGSTVFGKVTEGMDVVLKIKRRDPSVAAQLSIVPQKLLSVEIEEKPARVPAPATWVPFANFDGKGTKTTETFKVSATEWRIEWQMKDPSAPLGGFLQIYVYRADGTLHSMAANSLQAGQDSSVVHEAGSYYLFINAGQPYALTVSYRQ